MFLEKVHNDKHDYSNAGKTETPSKVEQNSSHTRALSDGHNIEIPNPGNRRGGLLRTGL